MAIIHRIGTPENDSEAKAIKRLGKDLPDDYFVFHNFEVTTGRGLPYEYDIAVLTPHALYHVEVKGYHGAIRGNPLQWVFENGGVYPSPIPLANKKSKVLAGKLRQYSHRLDEVFVETLILLTDDHARIKLNDDQAGRVVHLNDAIDRLSEPRYLPVSTGNVTALADMVCEALFTTRPAKKVQQIGLYDIVEKLDQDDRFTVFLAKHRFIQTQPLTVPEGLPPRRLRHGRGEAVPPPRDLPRPGRDATPGGAPEPRPHAGDMFAWNDDTFVEPIDYVEEGRLLEWLLDKHSERAADLGRENPDHQGRGRGAGARPPARRHPPRRPPAQHRRRPGRGREAGELRPGVHPQRPEPQHRQVGPRAFRPPLRRPGRLGEPERRRARQRCLLARPGVLPAHHGPAAPARRRGRAGGEGPGHRRRAPRRGAEPVRQSQLHGRPGRGRRGHRADVRRERSDRYATLAEALDDLAICEA